VLNTKYYALNSKLLNIHVGKVPENPPKKHWQYDKQLNQPPQPSRQALAREVTKLGQAKQKDR
jgi:hypothetical protein